MQLLVRNHSSQMEVHEIENGTGKYQHLGIEFLEGIEYSVKGFDLASESGQTSESCTQFEIDIEMPNYSRNFFVPDNLSLATGFRRSSNRTGDFIQINWRKLGETMSISVSTMADEKYYLLEKSIPFIYFGQLKQFYLMCEVYEQSPGRPASDREAEARSKYLSVSMFMVKGDVMTMKSYYGWLKISDGFRVREVDEVYFFRKEGSENSKKMKVYVSNIINYHHQGMNWVEFLWGKRSPSFNLGNPVLSTLKEGIGQREAIPLRCRTGFFLIKESNECSPCSLSCLDCHDSSISCLACAEGHVRLKTASGDVCVPFSCPETYYSARSGETGFRCLKCDPNCLTCSKQASNCSACSKDKVLSFVDGETNTCYSCESTVGFYLSYKGICEACHQTCKTCASYGHDSCLSCPAGKFLTGFNTCEDCDVNSGRYFDPTKKRCLNCSQGCRSCEPSNSKVCLSCFNGYELTAGKCESCPLGYFWTSQRGCLKCASECAECEKSESNCTKCREWQDLAINSTCVPGKIGIKRAYFETHRSRAIFKFTHDLEDPDTITTVLWPTDY